MPVLSGNVAFFATNKAGWARFIGLLVSAAFFQVGDSAKKRTYYPNSLGHNLEGHTIYYVCYIHQPNLQVPKFSQQINKLQRFIGSP